MIEQYWWIVFSVIVVLIATYNTIMSIRDRNKKPLEELSKEFTELDKTVGILTNTLNNINDSLKEYMQNTNEIQNSMKKDISNCKDKIIAHDKELKEIEKIVNVCR